MTERHNHPRLHTLYNKGMGTAQENRNFIIKKLSDYYTFCCVALSFDISPIVDGMFIHK